MKDLRDISLAVFAIVLSNSFISPVLATPITTSFDTTVQFTSGIAGVNVGDSFSGSFTYDNDSAAATSVFSPPRLCGFGETCADQVITNYQFSDPAYTANISTPSLSYSSEYGVSVNVFNNFTMPSGLFSEEFTFGMLSNPGTYDFISIAGSLGSIGASLFNIIGGSTDLPEISFGIMFVGNENMLADTSLPVSIDDLLNSSDFIGTSLSLSQYALQVTTLSLCTDDATSCLGGDIPVQTGYIYGEEVSAPATLLLIIPGLLSLIRLSRK